MKNKEDLEKEKKGYEFEHSKRFGIQQNFEEFLLFTSYVIKHGELIVTHDLTQKQIKKQFSGTQKEIEEAHQELFVMHQNLS